MEILTDRDVLKVLVLTLDKLDDAEYNLWKINDFYKKTENTQKSKEVVKLVETAHKINSSVRWFKMQLTKNENK